MKKYILLLLILSGTLTIYGQAPEGFSYHAIVRDNVGNLLANQAVSFRFNILEGSLIGASVFQEEHNVVTDDFGVVTLIINNGTNKI
jgi:hypothetical protein